MKRINFNNVEEWNKEANPVENYKIDEDEFSDEENETETRLIDRREKNNNDDDSSDESSDDESDSDDRVDQKEKQKIEKQKENQNKKLEKFHSEIRAIHDSINGKEIKNLSAIKTQLSRDIIPLHIKNNQRKQEIASRVKKCEDSKQLTELLKYWIDEFSVVFKYELTSATK